MDIHAEGKPEEVYLLAKSRFIAIEQCLLKLILAENEIPAATNEKYMLSLYLSLYFPTESRTVQSVISCGRLCPQVMVDFMVAGRQLLSFIQTVIFIHVKENLYCNHTILLPTKNLLIQSQG